MSKNIEKFAVVAAVLISGCASVAVTAPTLEQRTSLSTGMAVGTFEITNRVDENVRTDYVARGKNGQVFNCYVTGTVTFMGRAVSDAMCTQVGGKTTVKPVSQEDNALVREYKKKQKN